MMKNSRDNGGGGLFQQADAVVVEDQNKSAAAGRVVFHPMDSGGENVPFVKGEVQPLEYRDINYARAFYVQVLAVVGLAVFYGPVAFQSSSGDEENTTKDDSEEGSTGVLFLLLIVSILTAAMGTAGFLTLMMNKTEQVLKVSFFSAPALLFVFGIVLMLLDSPTETNTTDDGLSAGAVVMIQALIFAAISACVYFYYRQFIPFAVSTLKVAGMAVRSNRGLYLMSAFMPFALTGWFLLWAVAIVGVFASADSGGGGATNDGDWTNGNNTTTTTQGGPNGLALFILVFSFYWTRYVIVNVFHTTTAGTVGAWWFTPLADPSLCSMEVMDSLRRSLTYSFGSICFGSLIVALVRTLEDMARSARRNRNGALLACILECILRLIRQWIEYFNSWAFCYVGLYGYDFLTAGRNVVSLFKNRGWSSFASDRLVFRVLYFANLGVAMMSGGMALLIDVAAGPLVPPDALTDGSGEDSLGDDLTASRIAAFFIGFIVGAVISSTALFVMESAVRTVIVCFAESPAEFQECHPDLCQLLKDGWEAAYPDPWANASGSIVWATTASRQDAPLGVNAVATATAVYDEDSLAFAGDQQKMNEKGGFYRA